MNKLLILLLFFLFSCAPKEAFQQEFPVVISDYYYSINGNKTIFIIQFGKAIPAEIQLQSLYFRNQKIAVKKRFSNIQLNLFSVVLWPDTPESISVKNGLQYERISTIFRCSKQAVFNGS